MKSRFVVFRIEQHSPIGALPGGHQRVLRRIDQPRRWLMPRSRTCPITPVMAVHRMGVVQPVIACSGKSFSTISARAAST
jgi:hypothetical protein